MTLGKSLCHTFFHLKNGEIVGREIITSLCSSSSSSELLHISAFCPWHIMNTEKALVMTIMTMILECLLCARLYIYCLIPESHKLQKTGDIYIFTHRGESLGSETLNNLPRSHSKYMMRLVFESPSI